jgi:glycosyltransferase involved in cell wall biosynthesis
MNDSNESLVSVLVPSYKAGSYLGHLIQSVLAQTYSCWELLILDDGSGDLTHPDVCGRLNDPRIRCYSWHPNRGVSQATRFLMEQARGEFWCYPGADDVLRPRFIEKRVETLRTHAEVSVVFGKGGQIDSEGKEAWFHLGRNLFDQMQPLEDQVIDAERMLPLLLAGNIVNTPSIMARSQATLPILTHYHMDWRYCQDWFYWLILAANGLSFYYASEILHDYRFHEQSLTSSQESWAWRNVEPALVLLVAMALASNTGALGMKHYRKCRFELYGNWLVRSARFRSHPSWETWSALARMADIKLMEWPAVLFSALWVFNKRRKARRASRVLHGLPSRFFADPVFD